MVTLGVRLTPSVKQVKKDIYASGTLGYPSWN